MGGPKDALFRISAGGAANKGMLSVPWVSLAKNRGLVRRQLERQQAPGEILPRRVGSASGRKLPAGLALTAAPALVCAEN